MNLIAKLLIICLLLTVTATSGWCAEQIKPETSSKAVNYQALAKESLDQMVAAYEAKNVRDFMALVSQSYTGDVDLLDREIRRQFSRFTNMSIRYSFNNVTFDGKGKMPTSVTYNKGYTDVKSGKQMTRQGQTSMVFSLDKGVCLLYSMGKPPLFGLK
jgi:hypothetical protein